MDISLAGGTSDEFTCSPCSPLDKAIFPLHIKPWKKQTIQISYTPNQEEEKMGYLTIISNDRDFPKVEIPLKSIYQGKALAEVTPTQLDFGYVAVGDQKTLSLKITNKGEGHKNLEITKVHNDPPLSTNFMVDNSLKFPSYLKPEENLEVQVTYKPSDAAIHQERLIVATNDLDTPNIPIKLLGISKTPPKIEVNSKKISFMNVEIGKSQQEVLIISNQGGSDLDIRMFFAPGSDSDFSFSPTILGKIAAGGKANVYVEYTAAILGRSRGTLVLSSNDPNQAKLNIELSGMGIESNESHVLKLELTYENGDDSMIDNDFRDVDLVYENPYGDVCTKIPEQSRNPNWGIFGTPKWFAFGAKEEPERIIHTNPGQKDGLYGVKVLYQEDCEDIPTQTIALLLGISVDALITGLSEGVLRLNVGDDIEDIISQHCFGHGNTNATVTAYINGQLADEKTVKLNKKGDMMEIFKIERKGNKFIIK